VVSARRSRKVGSRRAALLFSVRHFSRKLGRECKGKSAPARLGGAARKPEHMNCGIPSENDELSGVLFKKE